MTLTDVGETWTVVAERAANLVNPTGWRWRLSATDRAALDAACEAGAMLKALRRLPSGATEVVVKRAKSARRAA